MRSNLQFIIDNPNKFAEKLAVYLSHYSCGVLLRGSDTCNIPQFTFKSKFDIAAGLGSINTIQPNANFFNELSEYSSITRDWLFGYFSYDLKNEIENLQSSNFDGLEFPVLFFFQPEIVLVLNSNILTVHYFSKITSDNEINVIIDEILNVDLALFEYRCNINFKSRFTKLEYISSIEKVKQNISLGDIYEMNLCQEFYAENCQINPSIAFNNLYQTSPTPFGAFLKLNDKYLMCASPERYIRKEGNLLISQPIKGTAPRNSDYLRDEKIKEQLAVDPKERAENIMIVDLVRNDLSKVATKGSVTVTELCGIYSFKQVHQMISTVTCNLKPSLNVVEPIKATFPMGSMTGAPKIRAMELIEKYERTKRGLFSGTIGYITPESDFDFNVVIRSLLFNGETNYLSFSVGGAITINSDPEKEYNECLLKAKAILTSLNATIENAK